MIHIDTDKSVARIFRKQQQHNLEEKEEWKNDIQISIQMYGRVFP